MWTAALFRELSLEDKPFKFFLKNYPFAYFHNFFYTLISLVGFNDTCKEFFCLFIPSPFDLHAIRLGCRCCYISTVSIESRHVERIDVQAENLPANASFDPKPVLEKLNTKVGDPFSPPSLIPI